jgi:hypothetical protein
MCSSSKLGNRNERRWKFMKKLAIFACMMMLGTAVFASSLGVPWFVDGGLTGQGVPPTAGLTGLIYLHNNNSDTITCAISYFDANGNNIGTKAGDGTTFAISANASIAFRPNTKDPSVAAVADLTAAGLPIPAGVTTGAKGQEEFAGYLVPDRNTADGRTNGSCVIQWVGPATTVQGAYMQFQPTTSVAYLLPPGA